MPYIDYDTQSYCSRCEERKPKGEVCDTCHHTLRQQPRTRSMRKEPKRY